MGVSSDTEPHAGAARHQRADAARNRVRLLQAAGEMFRERGVEVGVGEIADRAGIGRATLFRNFPTKKDLIVAVVAQRMLEAVAEGRERLARESDRELLFPFVSEMVGLQQVDRSLFDVVGSDEFLNHPEMRAAQVEIVAVIDEMIVHDQRLGLVRDGIGAIDVLMLVKGACVVATALAERGAESLGRHLSLVHAAITAPGRECPLLGEMPTLGGLAVASTHPET
jgi:AcrR family transcriptional regulator